MNLTTSERWRFRSQRQFVINLIFLLGWSILLAVISISAASSSSSNLASVSIGMLLTAIGIAGVVRAIAFPTVELTENRLIYRTLVRSKCISRSHIQSCGIGLRYRGLIKVSQPYLLLNDGSELWLAEMSGSTSGAATTDYSSSATKSFAESVNSWLGQTSINE